MDIFQSPPKKPKQCDGRVWIQPNDKDIYVQLALSLSIGVSAFLAFCVRHFGLDPSLAII
jgi:hypothetical protein